MLPSIIKDHLVQSMSGCRSVALTLPCTGSVGQGLGDGEDQRNEVPECSSLTSTLVVLCRLVQCMGAGSGR